MRVNLWVARRCRHGSTKPMESNWACANASGCSGSSRSVSASPGRSWPEPIQRGRKGIKKAPRADGERHRGPVGSGPSATFSSQDRAAACRSRWRPRIPWCIIIQRERASAISLPCACATAKFCSAARPEDSTERPSGSFSKCVSASPCRSRPPRSGHQRQRTISSLQTPSGVARPVGSPVRLGLPAAL